MVCELGVHFQGETKIRALESFVSCVFLLWFF